MQLQFLAPVELFLKQLRVTVFVAELLFFYLCSFSRCASVKRQQTRT